MPVGVPQVKVRSDEVGFVMSISIYKLFVLPYI